MNPIRITKLITAFILVILLTGAVVPAARAFDPRSGDTIVIAKGEVVEDDLYLTASSVTINGIVKGDVIAFGATIILGSSGVIEGDFMGAGQTVRVDGEVGDDARLAGYSVVVAGKIGDDLVSAGFHVETGPESQIGGSAVMAGAQALLDGNIAEDVLAGAEGIELRGEFGGDVKVSVGGGEQDVNLSPGMFMPNMPPVPNVGSGLKLAPGAKVSGKLEYTAPRQFSVPAEIASGGVTFIPEPVEEQAAAKAPPTPADRAFDWILGRLRSYFTLLFAGLLLLWLLPGFARHLTETIQTRALPSLGWGFITYFAFFFIVIVVVVVAIILVAILGVVTLGQLAGTTVGIGLLLLTALVLGFSLITAYLAQVAVSLLGGRLILNRIKPDLAESRIWPLALGLLIFVPLAGIPFLGWLVNALAVLLGLGALWLLVYKQPAPPAAQPVETIPPAS